MRSKIKNIQGDGVLKNPNGVTLPNGNTGFYKFIYEFENTETLSVLHKSKTPLYKIGELVDYEIKGTNEHGSWGKINKITHQLVSQPKNGDYQKGIEIGHAVNNGVNLHVAQGFHYNCSDKNTYNFLESVELYALDILKLSKKLKQDV